jgi:hypothetical protein
MIAEWMRTARGWPPIFMAIDHLVPPIERIIPMLVPDESV